MASEVSGVSEDRVATVVLAAVQGEAVAEIDGNHKLHTPLE
jgi:hypothetical protein